MRRHHTIIHNNHLRRFKCDWRYRPFLTSANLIRHYKAKYLAIMVPSATYAVFTDSPRQQAVPPTRKLRITDPKTVTFRVRGPANHLRVINHHRGHPPHSIPTPTKGQKQNSQGQALARTGSARDRLCPGQALPGTGSARDRLCQGQALPTQKQGAG